MQLFTEKHRQCREPIVLPEDWALWDEGIQERHAAEAGIGMLLLCQVRGPGDCRKHNLASLPLALELSPDWRRHKDSSRGI